METPRFVEVTIPDRTGDTTMILEYDQGSMNEVEFTEAVIDFILSNMQIEIV